MECLVAKKLLFLQMGTYFFNYKSGVGNLYGVKGEGLQNLKKKISLDIHLILFTFYRIY